MDTHLKFASALALLTAVVACGSGTTWTPPPAGDYAGTPPPPDPSAQIVEKDGFGDDDDDDDTDGGDAVEHSVTPIPASALGAKITQFVPAVIQGNTGTLPAAERKALMKIVEASKLLDGIFDRQASVKNPAWKAALTKDQSADGKNRLAYFNIMRGPWDRQDGHRPFVDGVGARPKGAGFYPNDLTAAQFDAYLRAHPNEATALSSLFTVVKRNGEKLAPVWYSAEYAAWLKPSAKLLNEAAALTKNKSLSRFLRARAAAFMSNDYYESDKLWMDLNGAVEVTIGPYEVYEDRLKANKAAFESFVTVSDPVASKELAKYKGMLKAMEANLPVDNSVKTKRGSKSPIRVVDLVFASGDARKSVQTIAFNLPNDERVRKEKGAKKVLLRNVIQKKFDVIMRPIGQRILVKDQQRHLSSKAFFYEVLFHELSHSLGPAMVKKGGKEVEVRQALEETYSAIEECKADVMGAYNVLYMIKRKELPATFRAQLLVSYFAGLFRSVRFGVAEAHGSGAAIQINKYLEAKAASFDAKSGRFTVDLDGLEKAITALTKELVMLQHRGDKAAAKTLLANYAKMSAPMSQAIASVTSVPVDLKPVYPLAGEKK